MSESDPDKTPAANPPRIERGRCHVLLAFDVGFAIDLDEVERRVAATMARAGATPQREAFEHKKRAPEGAPGAPLPVRITQAIEPVPVAPGVTTEPLLEITLYDFGGISIAYTLPLRGPVADLRPLSEALYDNAALEAAAKAEAIRMIEALRPAVARPAVQPLVEDYVIFEIVEASNFDPRRPSKADVRTIAQILRAETQPLGEQEVAEALAWRVSYGEDDLAIIDWNAAVVFDADGADLISILEYANVQLLEMRCLDLELDRALDEAYAAVARAAGRWRTLAGAAGADLRRVALLQADAAAMFESVSNAFKLVGDQFLARVYRAAAQRFHLPRWNETIDRKLQVLDSMYGKVSDRQSNFRMEALEWIIILLIAFEIAWALLTRP